MVRCVPVLDLETRSTLSVECLNPRTSEVAPEASKYSKPKAPGISLKTLNMAASINSGPFCWVSL